MVKNKKEKKVLITLWVDEKERDDFQRMADKDQGGNVSRYIKMLHRERMRGLK